MERADPEEVKEGMAEGVKFRYLSAPTEILGEAGKVTDIKLEIMELGKPDEKGRRKPVGTGKFDKLPIDTVMYPPGQTLTMGRDRRVYNALNPVFIYKALT